MLNQTKLVPSGKLEAGEMGQSLVASKFQPFSASNRGGPDQNVLCHRRQRLRQRDVMTMRYCLLSALASLHAYVYAVGVPVSSPFPSPSSPIY
jgi:hypothetical protein